MACEPSSDKLKSKISFPSALKAFLRGFGSAITIIRDIKPCKFRLWANYESDAEALRNDWLNVGRDIWRASEKQSGRILDSEEYYSRHNQTGNIVIVFEKHADSLLNAIRRTKESSIK